MIRDTPTSVGEQIRRAREAAKLSQSEVAEQIGVSQPQISHWERGRALPGESYLELLDALLDLRLSGKAKERDPGEASQFGLWVQRTRLDAGMSVPELANRSGLSLPGIYNIESGRTANPRAETRARLSKALGTETPALIVEATEAQSEVVGLGTFVDFNPHDENDLPADSGVYVFYDVSDRPIYVGESDNIKRRVRDHQDKFWFKRPIVETASYVTISERDLRRKVEQILIRFLKSNAVINKQHVDR